MLIEYLLYEIINSGWMPMLSNHHCYDVMLYHQTIIVVIYRDPCQNECGIGKFHRGNKLHRDEDLPSPRQ